MFGRPALSGKHVSKAMMQPQSPRVDLDGQGSDMPRIAADYYALQQCSYPGGDLGSLYVPLDSGGYNSLVETFDQAASRHFLLQWSLRTKRRRGSGSPIADFAEAPLERVRAETQRSQGSGDLWAKLCPEPG